LISQDFYFRENCLSVQSDGAFSFFTSQAGTELSIAAAKELEHEFYGKVVKKDFLVQDKEMMIKSQRKRSVF